MNHSILVLNGPNLNMLGSREPSIYGKESLADMEANLLALSREHGLGVTFFQSNHEGAIIDRIQESRDNISGIIANLGGFTHTSIAIRDAFLTSGLPVLEVHVSNVARREDFRQVNYLSDIAIGSISGFGILGYQLAFMAFLKLLPTPPP
ncbi:MAG: type II 3-dehydroquinate dehydratase [Leptospirillum sp.]|jgi:3-dehydroquinate dehydratase-2|nr:type II 3-dehydroquinate dehydratase [Nitrospiraceae bacterium]